MDDQIELIWEWGSMSIPSIKDVPSVCARYTNMGWAVYGLYPTKSKGIDYAANAYDLVVCRQRPLTENEKVQRETIRAANEEVIKQ